MAMVARLQQPCKLLGGFEEERAHTTQVVSEALVMAAKTIGEERLDQCSFTGGESVSVVHGDVVCSFVVCTFAGGEPVLAPDEPCRRNEGVRTQSSPRAVLDAHVMAAKTRRT